MYSVVVEENFLRRWVDFFKKLKQNGVMNEKAIREERSAIRKKSRKSKVKNGSVKDEDGDEEGGLFGEEQ